MTKNMLAPGSPEWQRVISPSKVAAILGVSRFESPYRLWHRMKGLADPAPPSEIFALGHDFEPAMASIWRRENPEWRLSPGEVQYVLPAERFGYPAAVTLDRRASRGRARRVVEFKTARDLSQWGDRFTDQAPADYVAQVMTQMAYSGFTDQPAHLMVLGPFFKAHTYLISFDQGIADHIHEQCRQFWESLEGDEPPPLDDSVATYEVLRELHPDIDGSTVEVDPELAERVLILDSESKVLASNLRGAKSALLDAMGNAQTAMCGDIKIADRREHASGSIALSLATKNAGAIGDRRNTNPEGIPAA
jgi:predicted phage-related endonuclease